MYHALLAQAEIEHRSMTLVVPGDTDREEPRRRLTRIVHVRWLAGSDGPSLARAVACCLEDQRGRRARVAKGLETASRFEWSASASRLLRLYDRVHAERLSTLGCHLASLPTAA